MEIEGPRRNSSFPYKETLDYAKNLAFSAGVCAFSLTTTKGVGEARESPFWLCFSFVTGALMGLLTVCATRAYSQSFPAASKTARTVAEVFAFVFWSATVYFVKWKIDQ